MIPYTIIYVGCCVLVSQLSEHQSLHFTPQVEEIILWHSYDWLSPWCSVKTLVVDLQILRTCWWCRWFLFRDSPSLAAAPLPPLCTRQFQAKPLCFILSELKDIRNLAFRWGDGPHYSVIIRFVPPSSPQASATWFWWSSRNKNGTLMYPSPRGFQRFGFRFNKVCLHAHQQIGSMTFACPSWTRGPGVSLLLRRKGHTGPFFFEAHRSWPCQLHGSHQKRSKKLS